MRALLLGVRDHLRMPTPSNQNPTATVNSGIGHLHPNPNNWIELSINGTPNPTSQHFVSIHQGSFAATGYSTESLNEELEVMVTVSMRMLGFPTDSWTTRLVYPDTADGKIRGTQWLGLMPLCELIRASLHLNDNVRTLANAYIAAANPNNATIPANGFADRLYFSNMSPPQLKGGSWWEADSQERYAGMAITISFRPVQFLQRADIQR